MYLFFYIIYHTKRDAKRVGTLNYNFISCFCFISISATRENVQLIFLIIQGIAAWQHPVIVLKDVPFSHLQGIVEFIYHGEVSIDQVSHFVCCSISWYIWVLWGFNHSLKTLYFNHNKDKQKILVPIWVKTWNSLYT